MDIFYFDKKENLRITWKDLIYDLNTDFSYRYYCYDTNFYEIFKTIIKSILLEKEVVVLDYDFSSDEVEKLTGFTSKSEINNKIIKEDIDKIVDKSDLVNRLQNRLTTWKIKLYTSGTTGLPKQIMHSFKSLTRFTKISEKHVHDIWGLAYNPTHIAGIQVFLQALLNGNPIFRLFGLSSEDIYQIIEDNNITHISATPTFYRMMLTGDVSDKICSSVKSITSGGEKYDNKLMEKIAKQFPHANILNVYASTEAGTLFASKGDKFTIKPEFSTSVKIVNNEIVIKSSLLGDSSNTFDEWYYTGDLVEIINNKSGVFKFKQRKNEMLNVGGYKVNPLEVEDALRSLNGIKEAYVYGKKNSVLGNIVCCNVVLKGNLSENEIFQMLRKKLQEFKIPRIINIVDNIELTRSGKIKRSE